LLFALQEPDAARTQAADKSDPDFSVAKDEMAAADAAAAEEPGTGEAATPKNFVIRLPQGQWPMWLLQACQLFQTQYEAYSSGSTNIQHEVAPGLFDECDAHCWHLLLPP
jgi:hypothetical protein